MTPLPGNSAALARPRDREGLADILERILDKGVVIAGDIAINLLDIELLTIRVRLLIASADKAAEMGIDWWRNDGYLTGRSGPGGGERALEQENCMLRELYC